MLLGASRFTDISKKQSSSTTVNATTGGHFWEHFFLKIPRPDIKKSSGRQQHYQKSSYQKRNLRFGKKNRFYDLRTRDDINTVLNIRKMNYNFRKNVVNDSVLVQFQSQDNAKSRDIIDDSEHISDALNGLTQNFQDLSVKEQFHPTTVTILFIPDTVNELYKVQVLENLGNETKIRCSDCSS